MTQQAFSKERYGLVSFVEPGMPETAIRGRFLLLEKVTLKELGDEPHWKVEYGPWKTCYVPESSVIVLEN